jgi:hypothetical protein
MPDAIAEVCMTWASGQPDTRGVAGRRFVAKIVVEELNPVSRVRWKVSNAAWPGSDIEFHLKAEGNDATLVFAHHGFPRADEGYASATTRWGLYLSASNDIWRLGRECRTRTTANCSVRIV